MTPDPPAESPAAIPLRQLLDDARHGSRAALGRIFDTYRVYLLQIANDEMIGELQGKAGASDLVQQTFLEAQQDFERFQGASEGELLAWLRRILHNNLANFARHYRGTAKRQVGREVALPEHGSSVNPLGQLPAADPSPSGQAIAREQAAALEQALARLPEEYRQVILLRNRDRHPFEAIGQRMNRSPEAVRKLWTRAIERLEQELPPSE